LAGCPGFVCPDPSGGSPIPTIESRRDAWPSYATIATIGYVIYGIGAIAPYLGSQLGLSDGEVGLHSTALAVGLVVAGSIAAGLDRLIGEVAVRALAIAGLAVAVVALAIAPAFAVTLGASILVGFGTGTLLAYANAILAQPGGRPARLRVARANVWAMVAAFACPLALATAVTLGVPWGFALAPAFVLFLVIAIDLRSGPRLEAAHPTAVDAGRLPRGYWLAWTFLVAVIAVEFSIVFWGATLVQRRTGVDTAVATFLGGLFLGGMFMGRLAQSFGLGTGGDLRRPAAVGIALAAIGASVAWVSTTPALSGVALFVAGLGVAGLYPLGVAAALAAAPGRLTAAGARLTLASGTAVLVAPFALGLVADAAGVEVAWGLVVVLAVAALALVLALPAAGGGEPAVGVA
jgi:MFS family permease